MIFARCMKASLRQQTDGKSTSMSREKKRDSTKEKDRQIEKQREGSTKKKRNGGRRRHSAHRSTEKKTEGKVEGVAVCCATKSRNKEAKKGEALSLSIR